MSLRGGYVLPQIYRYKRARPCISFLRCRRKSATNPQRNGTARVMLFMSSRAFPPRAQSVQEWHLTAMRFSLSLKIVLRTHADIDKKVLGRIVGAVSWSAALRSPRSTNGTLRKLED